MAQIILIACSDDKILTSACDDVGDWIAGEGMMGLGVVVRAGLASKEAVAPVAGVTQEEVEETAGME